LSIIQQLLHSFSPETGFPEELKGTLLIGHRLHKIWSLQKKYKAIFSDIRTYKNWIAGCSLYTWIGDNELLYHAARTILFAEKTLVTIKQQESVSHSYQWNKKTIYSAPISSRKKRLPTLKDQREASSLSPSISWSIESSKKEIDSVVKTFVNANCKSLSSLVTLSSNMLDIVNTLSPGSYSQVEVISESILHLDQLVQISSKDYELLINKLKKQHSFLVHLGNQLQIKESENSFTHLTKLLESSLSQLKDMALMTDKVHESATRLLNSQFLKSTINSVSELSTGEIIYV
jgi:hypothetical protein